MGTGGEIGAGLVAWLRLEYCRYFINTSASRRRDRRIS